MYVCRCCILWFKKDKKLIIWYCAMVCLRLRRTHPLSCLALTRHWDNHVQYQTSYRHNVLRHVWILMKKPRNRRSQIFIALTNIRFECVTDLPMHSSLRWPLLLALSLQSPTAVLDWEFAEKSVINCIRNVRLWFVFSSIKFIVSNWLKLLFKFIHVSFSRPVTFPAIRAATR